MRKPKTVKDANELFWKIYEKKEKQLELRKVGNSQKKVSADVRQANNDRRIKSLTERLLKKCECATQNIHNIIFASPEFKNWLSYGAVVNSLYSFTHITNNKWVFFTADEHPVLRGNMESWREWLKNDDAHPGTSGPTRRMPAYSDIDACVYSLAFLPDIVCRGDTKPWTPEGIEIVLSIPYCERYGNELLINLAKVLLLRRTAVNSPSTGKCLYYVTPVLTSPDSPGEFSKILDILSGSMESVMTFMVDRLGEPRA